MNQKMAMIVHASLAAIALIGLIVLQALHDGNPQTFAILGTLFGGNGVMSYVASKGNSNAEEGGK